MTLGALLLSTILSAPGHGPGDARLYGRVTTSDGDVVEGYLRWDQNEASPQDFLDAAKVIPLGVVREAERLDPEFAAEMRRERSIVAFGVRIRWDEDDLSGPQRSASAIRFAHIESLVPIDRRSARLTLRNGQEVELVSTSTDIGVAMRDLVVERAGRAPLEIDWSDLSRVDFFEPPSGAPAPTARRLYGTVSTWGGQELTGTVAWDRDEVLGSDVLDGREEGTEYDLVFEDIEVIEPQGRRSARVVLRSGVAHVLRGTNDVNDDNRGIEVSVEGLGRAIVRWSELKAVRFHPPQRAWAASPPSGSLEESSAAPRDEAGPITGTVYARDGRVLHGEIRWGLDEERRWEVLDGWSDGTDFDVEFASIRSIVPDGPTGATVTLLDGRSLRLEDTDDVGEGHRGVFVKPDDRPRRLVRWSDVDRVVLER